MGYELRIGDSLDDRFQITEQIQRSGMSTIFKAIDAENSRYVAVKVPHIELESDPGYFSRFEREEQIGKILDHPGVLKIVPLQTRSRPYIVMEYLEGKTLDKYLQPAKPFAVDDAIAIASRICEILQYMHEHGTVHRDLKPANIMMCNDGSLRIIDFGIAKNLALRRVTFGGFSPKMGTPHYMAPEQIKGKRGDARTDIYSLGVILYELTTGFLPFPGENTYEIMNARLKRDPLPPRDLNPDLSSQLEEIILHALEREPADRYASAAEMKVELEAPESVRLTGRARKLKPSGSWKNQIRRVAMVVFIAAMPVIAFFLFFLMMQHQAPKR
ncbi:MAG TPA: serine/threonine-protein kinase [Terriglobia bacterium]|nr:serine/threonine-protein kinase [Terriglobia bacterium]